MTKHDPNQAVEPRPWRRLWRDWLRPNGGRIALATGLMLVVAGGAAGYAKLIQIIVDAFGTDPAQVIWWGPAAVIGLVLIKGIAQYAQALVQHDVVVDLETDLKSEMFHRLVHADLARLQREAPAALATRFTSDINLVGMAVTAASGGMLSALTIAAAFAAMLTIDWSMTLVMALIFLLAIAPITRIGAKLRGLSRMTQSQVGKVSAEVSESLSAIRMVRTYQLEERLEGTARAAFGELRRLRRKSRSWQSRITPVAELLAGIAVAALLCLVAWRLSRGTTSLADFMGLLTGLGLATGPVRGMGRSYAVVQQGTAAMERIFSLFDDRNTVIGRPGATDAPRGAGAVEFDKVGFAYGNGAPVLEEVSFTALPGSKTAIVGPSGAGKSTIFNLLPRLFDVTGGAIRLDGSDIRDLTLASLRRQIALVGQESVALSGTVAENIGFGHPGADREAIAGAARAAGADGFILAMPQGYDTLLGPGGARLSGGEMQRLSIARAILRDSPVLLLDEPTSALDAVSEEVVRQALARLGKGRTTLVIAHRLATVLDADQILVMDGGRIVERGRHAALLESGGLYAELYRLQFAGQADTPDPASR